ncbi:MAG: hypothetical protein K1X64_13975 [Myxococcaceae bacterium]|nr:hypothetical protein [Myxococcaceae bacterium]
MTVPKKFLPAILLSTFAACPATGPTDSECATSPEFCIAGHKVSVANDDVCSNITKLVSEAQKKLGNCDFVTRYDLQRAPEMTETSCRSRLPVCSTEDRKQLDTFLNCLRNVQTCERSNQYEFRSKGALCTALLMGVSPTCRNNLSQR